MDKTIMRWYQPAGSVFVFFCILLRQILILVGPFEQEGSGRGWRRRAGHLNMCAEL